MTDEERQERIMAEREHCEAVARDWTHARERASEHVHGEPYDLEMHLADLLERERAGLLARAEAAEREVAEWKHATVCETTAEACADYDELEATVADLRAKLAAAEARVAELGAEVADHEHVAKAYKEHSFTTLHERLDREIARAEKAEARVADCRGQGEP